MTCRDVMPLLSAAIDGALSSPEETALRAHVHRCAECRSRLAHLTRARDIFRDLAPARRKSRRTRALNMPPASAATLGLAAALIWLLAMLVRSPVMPPRSGFEEVVLMDLQESASSGTDQPCFLATDCGVASLERLP